MSKLENTSFEEDLTKARRVLIYIPPYIFEVAKSEIRYAYKVKPFKYAMLIGLAYPYMAILLPQDSREEY